MTAILHHTDWLSGRVPNTVRDRLRQLVEVVGYLPHQQPLAVITADAVLLAANRPFLDLLGATSHDQLGGEWDDYLPGWSERTCEETRVLTFEDYVLPLGGDPAWVRIVACPVFAPGPDCETDEALAAWALFVTDRRPGREGGTERRRAAMLDLMLESPSEFVVQLGPDGVVEYISPSLRRALGMFGDGVEGRPLATVHQLAGAGFDARFASVMGRLLGPPYRAEFEMTMTTADAERVVEWRFESLLADGGSVLGAMGMGRDVTERHRAEVELGHSELRLRTLVEATNQLIWTTAPGGVVQAPLESWSAFTGQSDEEIEDGGWMDAVHPGDRERVREAWAAALSARDTYRCEYRLRTAAGSYRWIEARAVPLPGGGARPRWMGVGHDITGRKTAEVEARRLTELQTMAASVSARLAAASLETASAVMSAVLRETGTQLGADRASLCILAPDGVSVQSSHCWLRSEGRVAEACAPSQLCQLDWLRRRADRDHAVVLSVDDLPPEAAAEREALASRGIGAVLVVALHRDDTLLGLLAYEVLRGEDTDRIGPRWDQMQVSFVRMVADQLTRLVVWGWDEQNLRGIADCFLAFGPDVEDNLEQICKAAASITTADVVLYTRRHDGRLVLGSGWNVPEGLPRETPVNGRLDSELIEHPGPQVRVVRGLQDTAYARTSPVIRRLRAQTYAGFPVLVDGEAAATLSCLFMRDVPLRESQLELMRVLGRAASVEEERRRALEDRLFGLGELERAMERTVATLSAAVGRRDPYTAGHERRVSELCSAIGVELGLDPEQLRLLRLAATVHDIGKISLPAEILTKPTKLSKAEFELIKRHSEAGWEMLEPAALPGDVMDAVHQHHERLDGSGYPEGLHGEQIGLFARIIAVADVVEAMSSDRPYRPAIGIDIALVEIEEGRGTHYDERVSDACLRLFHERRFVFSADPEGD